jgi:hypothetical protein
VSHSSLGGEPPDGGFLQTRRQTRRQMLAHAGKLSLAVGAATLLGTQVAQAAPDCCEVHCTIDEGACSQNPCPTGQCCYHCVGYNGCSDNYRACLDPGGGQGCKITGWNTCGP